jgi:hypothetical protein
LATEELPIAVVIMCHIENWRSGKNVLTTEDSSILRLIEWPATVKVVSVRRHAV